MLYLSYIENEKRAGNAGYVKIESKGSKIMLDMQINLKNHVSKDKFEAVVNCSDESLSLGMIYLRGGVGGLRKVIESRIRYEDICDIRVIISPSTYIIGKIKECKPRQIITGQTKVEAEAKQPDIEQFENAPSGKEWEYKVIPAQDKIEAESVVEPVKQPTQEGVRQILHDIRMTPDKWQQLLKNYKQINPYADERLYISIEPKDFVIMSSEYHQLAHNSFLLHGFYNYRHIILGKENEVYYIGVPGVYYEREKSVAKMFGFEAFECEGGKPANGMLGYYLKKVRI
jgi:hypothetical protein